MFAVTEIAPGSQQPSATQLQMQLIASTAMTQRVNAMDSGKRSGDTGAQGSDARPDSAAMLKMHLRKAAGASEDAKPNNPPKTTSEAAPHSIIEAQEATETDTKLTAAFQARHALGDLLSVIRDPEDRMLPTAPSED